MKQIRKVAFIGFYNEKNQILLQERGDYSKIGEEWAFFGGGVEPGETPKEGFLREAKEELGLNMEDFDYKYIGDYIFEFSDRIVHRSIFLIKTDLKETDFIVYEGAGAKYFDLDDAKKLKFASPVDETIEIIKKYM
ncbi:MAG: NUDIX hydrolase [Candidatus Gracilibacteria bacterium]|nr:NUDIX hydrolase [Candidatus Gracilibacteria bacterium]